MVYDNTTLMPIGSILIRHREYGDVLALFKSHMTLKYRILFTRLISEKMDSELEKEYGINSCMDIMAVPPIKEQLPTNQALSDDMKKNAMQNLSSLEIEQGNDFPTAENVVLVGAGNVSREELEMIRQHRKKFTVITVGKAQTWIQGDYYIDCDWIDAHWRYLRGFDHKNTIAHFGICVHPVMASTDMFKKITWFGGRWAQDLNIPQYHDGESSTFSALQFAAKTLRAKRIVMVGVEQAIQCINGKMAFTYWDAGLFIQGACWWLSRHGVEVWNCTPNTSVTAGVILGSLQDALSDRNKWIKLQGVKT